MQLWSSGIPYQMSEADFVPYLVPYLCEGAKTAIVLCPGGGYINRSGHEGKAVGEWLNRIGVSVFDLEYRVAPYKAPAGAADVQRAIRVVRREASQYGVERIGVMGFSAGGHLAATASVHYDKKLYDETDETDRLSAKPDFSVLCYPVIDMFEYRHEGSRENLIGANPRKELKEFYSLHLHVTDDTPPAFLWHTAEDSSVPVENSMLYAMALSEHKIPFEYHVYPFGRHGLGLAAGNEHVHQWTEALNRWLMVMGFKEYGKHA